MNGMLYIKLIEHSNAWNRKTIFNREDRIMSAVKKIFAYIPLVPIMVIEWVMWPVAKIHSGLSAASRWLREAAQ